MAKDSPNFLRFWQIFFWQRTRLFLLLQEQVRSRSSQPPQPADSGGRGGGSQLGNLGPGTSPLRESRRRHMSKARETQREQLLCIFYGDIILRLLCIVIDIDFFVTLELDSNIF